MGLRTPAREVVAQDIAHVPEGRNLHRPAGMTIHPAEQNARKALKITDRAYVLQAGAITLSGRGTDLLKDDMVKGCLSRGKSRGKHRDGRGSASIPFPMPSLSAA